MLNNVALYVCRGFITSFLLLLPATFLLTFVFSQPQPVKQLVKQAGIYSYLSRTMVDTTTASLASSGQTYGLSKEAVARAVEKAFPVRDIEKKGERLIDDTYSWLEGNKPDYQPAFDIESNKKMLTLALADEAEKNFADKPACSDTQLLELASDALTQSPCRPSNVDEDFLKAIFTQAAPSVVQEQNVALSNLSDKPTSSEAARNSGLASPQFIFIFLKYSFYIISGVILILYSIIFILTRHWRPFLKSVTRSLVVSGILLILYSLLLYLLFAQKLLEKIFPGGSGDVTQEIIRPFAGIFIQANVYFGIGYIVSAVVLFGAYRLLKPKQSLPLAESQPIVQHSGPPPSSTR